MRVGSILETVLYAEDLEAAEAFYRDVLCMEPFQRVKGRHVFFKLDRQMLLIFNPLQTVLPPSADGLPVPPHGMQGQGHVCFSATAEDLLARRAALIAANIPIEAEFEWPGGGRSIYFRDPAGNCIEFAEPKIWGFSG